VAGIDAGRVAGSGSNGYTADSRHCRVRLVSGGTITTVAGTSGCGGPPASDSVGYPIGLAVSGSDLFIADASGCRIRKLSAGTVTTVAGTGTCTYDGEGPATSK